MRYLSLLTLVFIIGCTMTRTMQVNTVGNNIQTIYGSGSVNAVYISNTTYTFMK